MRGDLEYPYEPLPAQDTPFAASLGDRAPHFDSLYGSSASSPRSAQRSRWDEDGGDQSPRAESPLPPSASGLSPGQDKPAPDSSLLKRNLRKHPTRGNLQQRESRAR